MVVALVVEQDIEPSEPVGQSESQRCARVTVGGVDAHSVIDLAAARRLMLSKVRERRTASDRP